MSEADSSKAPEQPTAAAEASPTAAPKPPAARKPAGNGRGLAGLALLVGLAGLAVGGYGVLQQQRLVGLDQQFGHLQTMTGQTREQLDALAARDAQLESRLGGLERQPLADELAAQQRLLATLQGDQQQLSARVEQVLGASRESWRLAEAEHLLRMAMLRLSALQDVQSATQLLVEADLILQKQDDPGAYAARRALLDGLEALRSLPALDRTGLFLQLGALRGQTAQLDALAPEFRLSEAAATPTDAAFWERWRDELSRYVRIDLDSDAHVRPLLAGQSLKQVRLALSLAIEQAQWAVLNGNAEVYRQSLEQARSLLDDLFSSDNLQSRALAERLGELAGQPVAVVLPDLTPALRALEAYIREREKERVPAPVAPAVQEGQPS